MVLVFANKQDLPNAMAVSELTDKLGLQSLRSRTVHTHSIDSNMDLLKHQLRSDCVLSVSTVVRSSDLRYTRHRTLWGTGLVVKRALQTLVCLLILARCVWTLERRSVWVDRLSWRTWVSECVRACVCVCGGAIKCSASCLIYLMSFSMLNSYYCSFNFFPYKSDCFPCL